MASWYWDKTKTNLEMDLTLIRLCKECCQMSIYGIECLVIHKSKRCHFRAYQMKGTKEMYTNGPIFYAKGTQEGQSSLIHLLAWSLQVQVSDWLNMYNNEISGTRLKHEAGNVRVTNCHTCIRKCAEVTITSTRNSFGFVSIYSCKEKQLTKSWERILTRKQRLRTENAEFHKTRRKRLYH